MGTFGKTNKTIMAQRLQRQIKQLILASCAALKEDALTKGVLVVNDEEAITYRLAEYYLNDNDFRQKNNLNLLVRFQVEVPVNFNPVNNAYIGRSDIRVVGIDYLRNGNSYGLIECKRLDGSAVLKREYVNEGVDRFTGTLAGYIKYPRTGWDMMIGYLVASTQFDIMLTELNKYLKKRMAGMVMKVITPCSSDRDWVFCDSVFRCIDKEDRTIEHIFYDLDGITQ